MFRGSAEGTSLSSSSKFPLSLTESKPAGSTNVKAQPMLTFSTGPTDGIINPVFVDSPFTTSHQIINDRSIDQTVQHVQPIGDQQELEVEVIEVSRHQETPFPSPPRTAYQLSDSLKPIKPETVDRTDSASSLSSSNASTVITNASSTSGLLPARRKHSQEKERFISSVDSGCCLDCLHYHQNKHRTFGNNDKYMTQSGTGAQAYAPYPPQWYYLLAADTKQFRKHRHTHYRRDCRQCREIVRLTFEQYYLRAGLPNQSTMGNVTGQSRSSSVDGAIATDDNAESMASVSLDQNQQMMSAYGPLLTGLPVPIPPSPTYLAQTSSSWPFSKSRASCGHSCLKFTILFYCCIAVIMSICFICYLTRMFGFMPLDDKTIRMREPSIVNYSSLDINNLPPFQTGPDYNTSFMYGNDTMIINDVYDPELPATNLLEKIRAEMIGLLVASAFLIIFILGLVGSLLESVLCLRIFGAILSYLFLLTFGSALYIVILLIISNVQLKLILSTISCAAVAITVHGLLAIAPFAFADLINQERNVELTCEATALSSTNNCTYFKYPSVRFFPGPPPQAVNEQVGRPALPKRRSYFGLGSFGHGWSRPTIYPSGAMASLLPPPPPPSSNTSPQALYRDTPIESIPTLTTSDDGHATSVTPPPSSATIMDNISAQELIQEETHLPTKVKLGSVQTVRFTDNWL